MVCLTLTKKVYIYIHHYFMSKLRLHKKLFLILMNFFNYLKFDFLCIAIIILKIWY